MATIHLIYGDHPIPFLGFDSDRSHGALLQSQLPALAPELGLQIRDCP
jgi:hypothetical protein